MRATHVQGILALLLLLSGCATPIMRVVLNDPNYPAFPRHPVGYAETECTYTADSKGRDQNGTYAIHVDSKKVTGKYADDCRSPTDTRKK